MTNQFQVGDTVTMSGFEGVIRSIEGDWCTARMIGGTALYPIRDLNLVRKAESSEGWKADSRLTEEEIFNLVMGRQHG